MYKVELTCGEGWKAKPIGGHLSLSSRLELTEVEKLARSMLQLARENDSSPRPDGYRVTLEDGFGKTKIPQVVAIGAKRANPTRRPLKSATKASVVVRNMRPLSTTIADQNERITNIIRSYLGLLAGAASRKETTIGSVRM